MKKIYLMFVTLVFISLSYADISSYYSFEAVTYPYETFSGINIPEVQCDDGISAPTPIGFVFPYGLQNYSTVKVSSNGWIGLGNNFNDAIFDNNLASTSSCPILAPLWDDLTMANGNVQYRVLGSAPYREFWVQYTNACWNYTSASLFNFQIKLTENGNIQFIYGPHTGNPNYPSASMGINMGPGGNGWFFSVTPETNTASSTIANNNVQSFPASGQYYSFSKIHQPSPDLRALQLFGPLTPVQNAPNTYSLVVLNYGINNEDTFQVKFYRGADIEIGSVAGQFVASAECRVFSISWTPSICGPETIYARIILPGDVNPDNNLSEILNINVVLPELPSVVIGVGNELSRIPVDFDWMNSIFECLYYPNELGFSGSIAAIDFYNDFVTDRPNGLTKIWLGTTTQADLSGGMIPASQLTQVFSGNVVYPSGQNTIQIILNTTFDYNDSNNLVMMVQRPMDSMIYSNEDSFICQTLGTTRSRYAYSDVIHFDPNNPPDDAFITGQFPKTTIYYYDGSASDDPGVPQTVSAITSITPNPFSASATLCYKLKDTSPVTLSIYNLRGQLVRVLEQTNKSAGNHSAVWDGQDAQGRNVAPGIYFCMMQANGSTDRRRLILIK